jgi:hypothetical protein
MAKFPAPPVDTNFETKGQPLPSFPWEQWFQAISAFLSAPQVPQTTPATSVAAGVPGSITFDANFLYVCVAKNIWRRVALSSF